MSLKITEKEWKAEEKEFKRVEKMIARKDKKELERWIKKFNKSSKNDWL